VTIEPTLTARADTEASMRAQFGRAIDACEDLLGFAVGNVLADWTGKGVESEADELVAGEIARGTKTFRASLDLCLSGYGPQAAMLNRSLFEGMAVAHWISANPEEAVERFRRHELHSRATWKQRLASRGWLDSVDSSGDVELTPEEREELDGEFGVYGDRPWYGIRNLRLLVEAIEHMWPEGPPRVDLWDFFAIPHADNNQTLHSGARALGTGLLARRHDGMTLDAGPSDVQVKRGLLGAYWSYAQLLGLMLDHFESPNRPEMDVLYPRGRGAFWEVDPAVARKTGRNDPCPCGSGVKFKRCHGLAAR
jgi:hypothetical protein